MASITTTQTPIRIPPGPFPFHIAMAVSSFNKTIARWTDGSIILVDEIDPGVYYTVISINQQFTECTTYRDLKAERMWVLLDKGGITASSPVWYPLAAPDPFPLVIGQVETPFTDELHTSTSKEQCTLPAAWHDFRTQLLRLTEGYTTCPNCTSDTREYGVYTHSKFHAHACMPCWFSWYQISMAKRETLQEKEQPSAPAHPNQAWYDHMGIENPHKED